MANMSCGKMVLKLLLMAMALVTMETWALSGVYSASSASSSAFGARPWGVFTGNCNASLPRAATIWKPNPSAVEISFPKVKPPRCASPATCSVNSTLHANVILQPGDSLRLVFDLDVPIDDKETTTTSKQQLQQQTTTTTTAATTAATTTTIFPPSSSSQMPSTTSTMPTETPTTTTPATVVGSTTTQSTTTSHPSFHIPLHRFRDSRLLLKRRPRDVPVPSALDRSVVTKPTLDRSVTISEVKSGAAVKSQLKSTVANMVTVYKVTPEAFEACNVSGATRVGQVKGQSGSLQGIITIPPTLLSIDHNYFLGRSLRWGGECLKVKATVKTAACGDDDLCSSNGICYATSLTKTFVCSCCDGGANSNDICGPANMCTYNPCQNDGVCIKSSQNQEEEEFQCLCMPGFEGKFCETRINACESVNCQNGGSCIIARDGRPHCSCPSGFVGLYCEEELTGCDSSPCLHGICVDQPHGYRCFCQPGYGGAQCDFEYNECDSSPCLNGGTCLDRVGGYQCLCHVGYTGQRCETKVNLCDPNPCGVNQHCVDNGGNVSCVCSSGPDLLPCAEISTACNPNPCQRGGTCWISSGTFFCACRPGLTGDRCQDVIERERPSVSGIPMEYGDVQVKSPLSLHIDHTHSVYVAIGTLASAVLIVFLTVSFCYCKVHETYKRWSPHRLPSLCRDYRMPTTTKDDHGMDVPLAVAMETETVNPHRLDTRHEQTPCKVYWSETRRDMAAID